MGGVSGQGLEELRGRLLNTIPPAVLAKEQYLKVVRKNVFCSAPVES